MLQISTISPETLELLINLQKLEGLKSTRLVGGTALALLLGHRLSVDLDFFGKIEGDTETIGTHLLGKGFDVKWESNTETIHIYVINGIKVDIVNYFYSWIEDVIVEDNIRLAGLKDIAAMKISAITNRGSKKDFIDIYFLLNHFSMEEIMQFYLDKYPNGSSFLSYKSLTYFDDAEPQVMPKMLIPTKWEDVKAKIADEVKKKV
jgi:predicted nucleotidyltransferase component of viral defense system